MLTGKRARETLQELGPIAAGQRALARAGEGSALKNFCTGFLNGKFSIDTIYFQDFANGTDNINKSSTRGFRHRQSVPPHPRAGHLQLTPEPPRAKTERCAQVKMFWADCRRTDSGSSCLDVCHGLGNRRWRSHQFDNVKQARIN